MRGMQWGCDYGEALVLQEGERAEPKPGTSQEHIWPSKSHQEYQSSIKPQESISQFRASEESECLSSLPNLPTRTQ